MKKANFRTKEQVYSRLADMIANLDKEEQDAAETLGNLKKQNMDKLMNNVEYSGSWEQRYDLSEIERYESIMNAIAIIREALENSF